MTVRKSDVWGIFSRGLKAIPGGCWCWVKGLDPKGYGRCRVTGKGVRKGMLAHRLSWELHFGPIPGGLCVLHRCDNPGCVNPGHLFLGTRADNNEDMAHKGRTGNRKLTTQQASEVKAKLTAGASERGLAAEHGMNRTSIHDIKAGRSYAWVTLE